jgi:hypothetical protein
MVTGFSLKVWHFILKKSDSLTLCQGVLKRKVQSWNYVNSNQVKVINPIVNYQVTQVFEKISML